METGATDLNYSRIVQLAAIYNLTAVQLIDPAHDPLNKDHALLLQSLHDKLARKNEQIVGLQSKMIDLYELLNAARVKL